MKDRIRGPRVSPGGSAGIGLAPIQGRVDPQAIEKAREALRVKMAKGTLKGMAGREDGARQLAESLRRLMRD